MLTILFAVAAYRRKDHVLAIYTCFTVWFDAAYIYPAAELLIRWLTR